MIPYGKQWIDENDIKAVVQTLKSDFLTQGPKVAEFEKKLSEYCQAKYAVAFNSGTSALHAAYFAAGLKEGDEFITSPITFAATANAGLFLRALPVFVDIEKDTGNINPELLTSAIGKKTKLIVPVHYAGHPCDMEKIKYIADMHQLKIVEDACHALGAKFNGTPIGSCKYSHMTVFSFHPVKHITTGEGGAVLTNDKECYEKLLMFRNHGITKDKSKFLKAPDGEWYYEMQFLGFNYRMSDIHAALGITQLDKLNFFIKRRRVIATLYQEMIKNSNIFEPATEKNYAYHAYHLYPLKIKPSYIDLYREIFEFFKSKQIGVQKHYIPVYKHPYYQSKITGRIYLKNAEQFYKSEISIPIFPKMSPKEIDYVLDTINEVNQWAKK